MKHNPIPLTFAQQMERQRENRHRFEVYRDMTGEQLPAPVVVATPDRVFVTVTDTDDLVQWLTVYGGTVHKSPVFDGMQMWTLRQEATGWSDGRAVPVQISALAHEDELVEYPLIEALEPSVRPLREMPAVTR